MAEQILSPGVFKRENDQSFITQGPIEVGAAIIGPTVKGPIETPTLVTSYSQFSNIFGETIQSASNYYTYMTNLAAKNYFAQGGSTMLITRVVSGSSSTWNPASNTIYSLLNATSASFTIETLSKGTLMNSTGSEISGALGSGSKDNVRWEISNSDTGSGTFTLLVRRGDDNTRSKTILETWTNLSLDPLSPNFVSRVIGDQVKTVVQDPTTGNYYIQTSGSFTNQSSYIRVSGITTLTPNYFDNNGLPKNDFTSSLPRISSGSFSGGTGTNISANRTMNFYNNINATDSQGVIGNDYSIALNILLNQDEYSFNLLTAPGITYANSPSTLDSLINVCSVRGDALSIIDLANYGSTIGNVISKASNIDSNYASAYWPWLQMLESNTNQLVWAPASITILGVLIFNDKVSAPWFAPAGTNRGGISGVVQAERKLSPTDRDSLYLGKVNPIASLPGQGIVAFGQKTLQTKDSALNRVNVRRLLIELKGYIGSVAKTLVFEQNTLTTRNKFLSTVNPYLESIQQREGLYAFRVIMDESNNTADVIDRNQLVGQIYLQPTKTAEFIILDFNVQSTGATFS